MNKIQEQGDFGLFATLQEGCGVCQGISIGSETPTTPRRFNTTLTKNNYIKKVPIIAEVKTQFFKLT